MNSQSKIREKGPVVLGLTLLSLLVLLSGFSMMPLQRISALTDSSQYSSPQNLSNDAGPSYLYFIATYKSNVYVVWEDSSFSPSEILFRASTNHGISFGSSIDISSGTANSCCDAIATSGSWVYVVWEACVGPCNTNTDIFFRASSNDGKTWGSTINISNNPGISEYPQISALGSDVYVAWYDNATGHLQVFFSRSTNFGATFSTPVNLSDDSGVPYWLDQTGDGLVYYVGLASYKSNVYVTWSDNSTGTYVVYFKLSTNHGKTFTTAEMLSDVEQGDAVDSVIASSSSDVYVAWALASGPLELITSQNLGSTFGAIVETQAPSLFTNDLRITAEEGNIAYITWRAGITTTCMGTPCSYNYIYFTETTNAGSTLTSPLLIGDGCCAAPISSSGANVFVAWSSISEPGVTLGSQVYVNESTNFGASFTNGPDVSISGTVASGPSLTTQGKYTYVTWLDDVSGSYGVYYSYQS